jgi:thiamine-monophosphate kinase
MSAQAQQGEFKLIERFIRPFKLHSEGLQLGPGDDAALVQPSKGLALAVTVDTVREGIHFGPLFSASEVGHKALAVNLSDLAAMGATPRWFLVALELPARFPSSRLDGIAKGMAALARSQACVLVGGNVTRGDRLALTITAIGEVPPKLALRRDGLRPRDVIAVTGELGAAALGLRLLKSGTRIGAEAQLRPTPRISAGLAARGLAHAAIDVSDGLAQDVSHLTESSGCGVELWADAIPMSPEVAAQPDALKLCLSGGEDYELVFGVGRAKLAELQSRLRKLGVPLTVIGRSVTPRGVWIAPREGERARKLRPLGFAHF